MTTNEPDTVAAVFRGEYGRAVSVLTRVLGDLDLAEDAVAEAFAVACERWPTEGPPPSPAGWIITTARRKAVDRIRRETARDTKHAHAALLHDDGPPFDPGAVHDDLLRLVFTCCHPALARSARVALTLRLVGGLTTREIARAFLVGETTMARRLTRAKAKIRDARIPYRVPQEQDLPERWAVVLDVVSLIYNEGYVATQGLQLVRDDLRAEAIRLARLLVDLAPDEEEARGLLALLLLLESRRAARLGPDGGSVLLAEQDRSAWDRTMILEAFEILHTMPRDASPGAYRLQAAINAVHASAPSAEETDWAQIVTLYDALMIVAPSDVVALNRAVAVAETGDVESAWRAIEALDLDTYVPQHAARGYIAALRGRIDEARRSYRSAIVRSENAAERTALTRRLDALKDQLSG